MPVSQPNYLSVDPVTGLVTAEFSGGVIMDESLGTDGSFLYPGGVNPAPVTPKNTARWRNTVTKNIGSYIGGYENYISDILLPSYSPYGTPGNPQGLQLTAESVYSVAGSTVAGADVQAKINLLASAGNGAYSEAYSVSAQVGDRRRSSNPANGLRGASATILSAIREGFGSSTVMVPYSDFLWASSDYFQINWLGGNPIPSVNVSRRGKYIMVMEQASFWANGVGGPTSISLRLSNGITNIDWGWGLFFNVVNTHLRVRCSPIGIQTLTEGVYNPSVLGATANIAYDVNDEFAIGFLRIGN